MESEKKKRNFIFTRTSTHFYKAVKQVLPQKQTPTGCCILCSGVEGTVRAMVSMLPNEVPTHRLGNATVSLFLDRESQK